MRFHRLLGFVLVTLLAVTFSTIAPAQVGIGVVVNFGPPAIPVYVQPPCPGDGYLWVPGYWAWDSDFDDYYWVPGTWIMPPTVGYLWTPGYWVWNGAGFVFTDGYWGPVVGFYGGINYGFGYFGRGYEGGYWDHDRFYYNRAANNVNVTVVHNVYEKTVVNNYADNRVSYNGGPGGVSARPTAQEEAAQRDRHVAPPPAQTQHVQMARSEQQLRASVNQGKPPVAATDRPASFKGANVVAAQQAGAPYHPPAERSANRAPNAPGTGNAAPNPPMHAKDVQPHTMPAPQAENDKQNQQYQKQQQKLEAQQQKEHQQLQQQQEKEHQQAAKQQANDAQMQQMEQRHQQQTQQMEQKHNQQVQQMQQRQPPPPPHPAPKQAPPPNKD